MTITAKFASRCNACGETITPGQQIEWTRGEKPRHTVCGEQPATTTPVVPVAPVAVTYETVGARVYVRGNTFAIKDAIKSVGGHWDGDEQAWWIGTTKRAELEAAIASATPSTAPAKSYRPSVCKECGARGDRYRKIYRNGVCGDCYEDYAHGGQSYYDRNGNFVLGSND